MKFRSTAAAFVLALVGPVSSARAQASPIEFRGVPLGAEFARLRSATPRIGCRAPDPTDATVADSVCGADLFVSPARERSTPDTASGLETYAGALTLRLDYYQWHGRLAGVDVIVPSPMFEQVADAMRAKFGQPTETVLDTVQNGLGARFTQLSHVWKADSAQAYASQYAGQLDQAMVVLRWRPFADADSIRRGLEAKKRVRDM